MGNRLYENVQNDMKRKIERGVYSVGAKLESEDALCAEYNVSKVTLRTALANLINENYLESVPRIGYFVKEADTSSFLLGYNSEKPIKANITNFELIKAELKQETSMGKSPANRLEIVKRFMNGDNCSAVEFVSITFRHSVSSLKTKEEMMDYYENFSKKLFSFAEKKKLMIEAVSAEEDIAAMLECFRGDPLLKLTETHYDEYGKVFAVSMIYFQGDGAELTASNKNGSRF